jgi:rhodanese-related sulfurtransferase
MRPKGVTPDEVKRWLDAGDPIAFVDTRGSHAWETSDAKLPGAIRVPPLEVEQLLDQVPRDRAVVTYCT